MTYFLRFVLFIIFIYQTKSFSSKDLISEGENEALLPLSDESKCTDPLACFLESVVIDIPDIPIDINGNTLYISNFNCYGIQIDGIPSQYISPTTLDIGVLGLGTYCSGDYSYKKFLKGSLSAQINQTDFNVSLLVGKDGEYPSSMNFSSCDILSMGVYVSFTGGILDTMAPVIESFIEKAFNRVLCVKLNDFLSQNITTFLTDNLDPKLQSIVENSPSPLPEYDNHYLNWNEDSIILKIHDLVSLFQGFDNLASIIQCLLNSNIQAVKFYSSQINTFVKNEVFRLSESKGNLNFPLSKSSASFDIKVTNLVLDSEESLESIEILEPMKVSNVTLSSIISFGKLYFELDILLNLNITDPDSGKLYQYNENLSFGVQMTNFTLNLDLVVAVNEYILNSYFFDQLGTPNCWVSTLSELSIPNLGLNIDINNVKLSQINGDAGILEKDIVSLINNSFELIFSPDGFNQLVTDTIYGVFQGPIRNGLNSFFSSKLKKYQKTHPCLTHYPYEDYHSYIPWPNSSLINTINFILNENIGYSGINEFFNCATGGTGKLSLNTSKLHVQISGLNSFYGFKIAAPFYDDPSKIYNLDNFIGLGQCTNTACNPFEIIISSYPPGINKAIAASSSKLTSAFYEAMHSFKLDFLLENFEFDLGILLKIDKDVLKDHQFYQMGTLGCAASSFTQLYISNMNISTTGANLIINDGLDHKNITKLIDRIFSFISSSEKISQKNSDIAYKLSYSSDTCASGGVVPFVSNDDIPGGSDSSNSLDWKWELFILTVGCFLSLVALIGAYHYWGRDSKFNCLKSVFKPIDDIEGDTGTNNKSFYDRWDCKNSLLFHPKVPTWLRIMFPVAVLGNVAIFIASNISPDAVSVMVDIYAGSKSASPGSIFDFGLGSTVHDMWEAEVYALAILIAFFSGAWPYVKLLMMFLSWVLPPTVLSIKSRETVLIVLDVLGKWSLIDFFVMVLMLCAFYFQLYVGDNIEVDVTVLPKWGFYSFLLATMMSLGLGHIVLACHRLIVDPKVLPIADMKSHKESLSSLTYEFTIEHEDKPYFGIKSEDKLDESRQSASSNAHLETCSTNDTPGKTTLFINVTLFGKLLVSFFIIVTAIFVTAGTFILTMGFEFKGLTGWMLKSASKVDYSLVSVGTSVPDHSGHPNDFAVRWLQASFFLFGQAMPYGLLLCLLILWNIPLSLTKMRELFVLTEVLNAWSALDVYCIAIAASLLEIQQFAQFIVGDSCDSIDVFLANNFDTILQGDDTCFDVEAYLKPGSWTIFTAAGLLILVALPLLSVANSAIKLRFKLLEQGIQQFTGSRNSRIDYQSSESSLSEPLIDHKESTDKSIDRNLESPEYDEFSTCQNALKKSQFSSQTTMNTSGSSNNSIRSSPNESQASPDLIEGPSDEQNSDFDNRELPVKSSMISTFFSKFTKYNFNSFLLKHLIRLRILKLSHHQRDTFILD